MSGAERSLDPAFPGRRGVLSALGKILGATDDLDTGEVTFA